MKYFEAFPGLGTLRDQASPPAACEQGHARGCCPSFRWHTHPVDMCCPARRQQPQSPDSNGMTNTTSPPAQSHWPQHSAGQLPWAGDHHLDKADPGPPLLPLPHHHCMLRRANSSGPRVCQQRLAGPMRPVSKDSFRLLKHDECQLQCQHPLALDVGDRV